MTSSIVLSLENCINLGNPPFPKISKKEDISSCVIPVNESHYLAFHISNTFYFTVSSYDNPTVIGAPAIYANGV